MPLDATAQQKINTWFATHGGYPKCLVCKGKRWAVGDLTGLPNVRDGKVSLGGDTFLILPLACSNCGYCLFFNAVVLGLVS